MLWLSWFTPVACLAHIPLKTSTWRVFGTKVQQLLSFVLPTNMICFVYLATVSRTQKHTMGFV